MNHSMLGTPNSVPTRLATAVTSAKPTITSHLERIGPKEAEIYLESNTKNRTVRDRLVSMLADQMRAGTYKTNGDAIRFAASGRLLDGQHRLMAIVASGCSIETFVVRGLPEDCFDSIDCGRKRSVADVLTMSGESDANNLVGAINWLIRFKPGIRPHCETYPATLVEEWLAEHPGIRHSLKMARSKSSKLAPASMVAAIHYLCARLDPVLAEVMVAGINEGFERSAYPTFHALREKLMANRLSRAKLRQEDIFILIAKSWNKTRSGLSTTRIHLSADEVFPELI